MKLSTTQETRVRPAAVAGKFYPANPVELRELIRALLAGTRADEGPAPKAIIAPHAGYIYSGPIAASAHARLLPVRKIIKRVVLFGPSHFVPVDGLAIPAVEAFATPLGVIPLDTDALHRLRSLSGVVLSDEAHAREHSLEVHLPFLQSVLEHFTLVPLTVGDASPEDVQRVMAALWGGPETCIVVSSDLSHFHDSQTAREQDGATADAIEELKASDITENQACGRISIRALLEAARQHGLHARTLDLRNSGDTAGSRDRVVGYGAFAFEEN